MFIHNRIVTSNLNSINNIVRKNIINNNKNSLKNITEMIDKC